MTKFHLGVLTEIIYDFIEMNVWMDVPLQLIIHNNPLWLIQHFITSTVDVASHRTECSNSSFFTSLQGFIHVYNSL